MQLRDLVRLIRTGIPAPRRAVVVTFDDGYADNLYQAKPLLEQHEIPATVFVTTIYTETQREFWFDELEQLVLTPGRLPCTLHIDRREIRIHADLGDAEEYSVADCHRYSAWAFRECCDPTARHRLFRTLHDSLKPLYHDLRLAAIGWLQEWSGSSLTVRNSHRPLSSDELTRLGEGKLIEIGAHSDTHPVLSSLPAALQRKEIVQCKTYLENLLGCPVTSFAYPYGHPNDFTRETADILIEAGFECACSTIHGQVGRGADLFQLPRVYVGNWDKETFRRRSLDGSFG